MNEALVHAEHFISWFLVKANLLDMLYKSLDVFNIHVDQQIARVEEKVVEHASNGLLLFHLIQEYYFIFNLFPLLGVRDEDLWFEFE